MKQLYCCFVISLLLAIPCAAQVIIIDANGTGDYKMTCKQQKSKYNS